ncbi:MAG: hypothetical protein J6I62_09510 [Selenomonadaceae bacterium]|nr:hypothetical protein [Selenomonadaceae bacterium]
MPMQANMNVGIRPVERPQTPSSTEGVSRRGDGSSSSGFSPRTEVAIQGAVEDMAGILSKISARQDDTIDKMPEDLQKVVQNILKQAFSMNETLSKGIGSTLESQRFSLEQLTALSRMLHQLGNLVDKGFSTDFGDDLSALLKNFKAFMTETEGATLEPVLLNKASFELLDTKTLEELPDVLKALIAAASLTTGGTQTQAAEGNALGFLKQLVQYFMPKPENPSGGNGGQTSGNANANQNANPNANANNGGQPTNANTNTNAGTNTAQNSGGNTSTNAGTNTNSEAANNANTNNFANANGQTANAGGNANSAANNTATPQGSQQQNATGNNAQTANNPQNNQQTSNNANTNNAGGQSNNANANANANPQTSNNSGQSANNANFNGANANTGANTGGQAANNANANQSTTTNAGENANTNNADANANANANANAKESAPTLRESLQNRYVKPNANGVPAPPTEAQQARVALSRVPLQNTPQTMDTMKSMAEFLLKNNPKMSETDVELLQNFVNGRESVMTGKEARQLQTLLRICQQNVPTTLQQAAVQQNLPDLPRLWAFMTLCDFAVAKRMTGRQLKKAGKNVADLVLSMRHSMSGTNREVQGQRSLNFMMPLYMGDEEKSYPSYIHVYDENEQDPYTGEFQKETWLRLCVLTDNIGAVELTCRVYGEKELDMRLFFSDHETAEEFRDVIPDFISNLGQTRELTLNEIKVGAVDERRFL